MIASFIRRFIHSAFWFKKLLNFWPPFLGAGIGVREISSDFKRIHVQLPLRFYNLNILGMHFGGSIFAMTDPFFVLMLMKILGPGYKVIDSSSKIEFLKPGLGKLDCVFELDDFEIERILDQTSEFNVFYFEKMVEVKSSGEVIARAFKKIYIKKLKR